MASMSDFLEAALLNHIVRTTEFTQPSVMAVALLTTLADDANTGQFTVGTGVEVSDAGGYVRQDIGSVDADWTAPGADGLTDNVSEIAFPTATGDWGTIVGIALVSSVTYDAGDVFFHGALTVDKIVNDGDTFKIAIGDLDITLA